MFKLAFIKRRDMMNKRQFIESEKDCASMLGLSLKKYRDSIENIITNGKKKKVKKFDNTILFKLGLNESDLKRGL